MDIVNIVNRPYLGNNPYQELANDDDGNNTAEDTNIEIIAAPEAITKTIIYVDKRIIRAADRETTGVPDEHTGVATSDDEEITGFLDTEVDDMAAIDASIVEVAATINQELREANV